METTSIISRIVGLEAQVENGDIRPHQAFAQLYQIEQAIKGVKTSIADSAINYIQDKHAKGDEPVVDGYRMTVQYKRSFTYKHDPTWERFSTILKERQDAMKKSASMLAKSGTPYVDANGEEVPPAEIKTSSHIKMEAVK